MRHNLTIHYGVTHRNVFKHYNSVMGAGAEHDPYTRHMTGHGGGRGGHRPGRGGAAVGGRGSSKGVASMEACLVCEEQISKETMVFHLAHKHFSEKVAHLPQTRPFKCPECNHINEFQVCHVLIQ